MKFIVIWTRGFDKLVYGDGDTLQQALDRSLGALAQYLEDKQTRVEAVKPQVEIKYIGE